MPTFDGGHYFLTAIVPVRTSTVMEDNTGISPVHALRKRLRLLPTAEQSPASAGRQSPFARNTRNHLLRLVVIDDVNYNGRVEGDTLVSALRGVDYNKAQPQDHLACPFLVLAVDFDAKTGADSERDSYLVELWNTMEKELRDIFRFCEGFEAKVKDAASFAKYIASCQIETTMSFNDYYIDDPLKLLPVWSAGPYVWGILAGAVAALLGLIGAVVLPHTDLSPAWWHNAAWLLLVGVLVLALVVLAAYRSVMAAGAKPYPAAPDSDLPTVLKGLYLRRVFTRFAIENQELAANPASAKELYDNFAAFVAANKPGNTAAPTQKPGIVPVAPDWGVVSS